MYCIDDVFSLREQSFLSDGGRGNDCIFLLVVSNTVFIPISSRNFRVSSPFAGEEQGSNQISDKMESFLKDDCLNPHDSSHFPFVFIVLQLQIHQENIMATLIFLFTNPLYSISRLFALTLSLLISPSPSRSFFHPLPYLPLCLCLTFSIFIFFPL